MTEDTPNILFSKDSRLAHIRLINRGESLYAERILLGMKKRKFTFFAGLKRIWDMLKSCFYENYDITADEVLDSKKLI